MGERRADEERLTEAVGRALDALLADRDVSAIRADASGLFEVVRRGRREPLDARLDAALFEALSEGMRALAPGGGPLALAWQGHRLTTFAAGDRVVLFVEKAPALGVTLADLEEEGLLPPGLAEELVALLLEGHGLLVVGPARSGRDRLAVAAARAAASCLTVAELSGRSAEWLAEVPLPSGDLGARLETARGFGVDVGLCLGVTLDEVAALAARPSGLALVASVTCASAAQLNAAAASSGARAVLDAVAGQVCVLGYAPDGRARLLEHHVPAHAATQAVEAAPAAVAAPSRPTPRPAPAPALPHAALPPLEGLPPLEPLAPGPPTGWASSSPDDDPGWELSDGAPPAQVDEPPATRPAADSEFDRVLADVRGRPSFTPRPPDMHPQARRLQGDPFGGLTFEPPRGQPDGDEPDEEPDPPASRRTR